MNAKGKVLLVGSIGLPDIETVFRSLSGTLGALAPRYPDGECGPRSHWIMWQSEVFDRNPHIELAEKKEVFFGGETRTFVKFKVKPGANADDIDLAPLGYAREAAKSYETFKQLRADGVIPAGTRFQMSIPTPVAVCTQHIVAPSQALVAVAYERALAKEIDTMVAAIPASDLAIQWDVCQEILGAEKAWDVYYDDLVGDALTGLGRLSKLIPDECQMGIHLCYGDPGHKHIKEPEDLGLCVEFANGICRASARKVDWIHMPVPRDRTDQAYFAPLEGLSLTPETELYLGLVHMTDGLDGAKSRMAAAKPFLEEYGIATECGFGRRDPSTIPDLLKLHREIATL